MKAVRLQAIQITDNTTPEYVVSGKTIKMLIRNNPGSANDLFVGLNGNANSLSPLTPTDSLAFEAREGTYYDGNVLRFKFSQPNPLNNAVLIIETETEKTIC